MSRRRKRKNILKKFFGPTGLNLELDLEEGVVRETIAIGWLVLGLIILLAEFNVAGSLGSRLFGGLRFIFGLAAFFLPFLFLWIGLAIGRFFSVNFNLRTIIGVTFVFVGLPSLIHLVTTGDPLELAKAGAGGGFFGFYVSLKLSQIIGGIAAFILSLVFTLVGVLTIINKPLTAIIAGLFESSKNSEIAVNGKSEPISLFSTVKRTIGGWRENIKPSRARVLEMPNQKSPGSYPPPRDLGSYLLPSLELLETSDQVASSGNIQKNIEIIQKTLKDFNVEVSMSDVNVGPTVTQYTMKPADGVKLNQITARSNDLALALAAKSLRMEAPIPGKSAVGIEIPNKVIARVTLREILESSEISEIKSPLALALGRDVAGAPLGADLEKMPHLLIAGATGSGKSVYINVLILSLIFRNTPKDLRFILVDPKRVELTNFNAIPHLLAPVITEPDKTVAALKWAVAEMDRRYRILSETGKKNIAAYNQASLGNKMPYIIFIVDELADLMAVSARDVEGSIVRLAQMARATGIHLVLATQRPSVDVITGLIKANITTRIAFAVASNADSRTILDQSGAEKLLGNGDMLYLGNDIGKPKRIQGALASERDIAEVIKYVKSQDTVQYNEEVTAARASVFNTDGSSSGNNDDLYNEAMETVRAAGKASASLLQRRLRIGYARAARLLDLLEENGAIGPADGAKPREVYGADSASSNLYGNEGI